LLNILLVHIEDFNSQAGLRSEVSLLERESHELIQFVIVLNSRVKFRLLYLRVDYETHLDVDIEVELIQAAAFLTTFACVISCLVSTSLEREIGGMLAYPGELG